MAEKKDYSDLEKEQEEELSLKMELRKIQEENKKIMDQGLRFLLEHQDCLEHYQQKLFAKYCLEHNLTDQEIQRLVRTQMKKDFFNGHELGKFCGAITAKERSELFHVKGCFATRYTKLSITRAKFVCLGIGCKRFTCRWITPVTGWGYWSLPLCHEHYLEFKSRVGDKVPTDW